MCIIQQVKKMLGVGTPIVAVNSYDHPHTTERLVAMIEEGRERPIVAWNVADGIHGVNEQGEAAVRAFDQKEIKAANAAGPHAVLHIARKLPQDTVLIMDNLHWSWSKPPVMQAIQNLREPFKASKRCLIGLVFCSGSQGGNGNTSLPADLVETVSYVEDPLPTEEMLKGKVEGIFTSACGDELALEDKEASQVAQELRGCSPFRAEQLTALSLTRKGIDRNRLRGNTTQQINDTAGMAVETGAETFEDVGGLGAMKGFLSRYFSGPRRPTVVVRMEEIEKALAGAGTDTSGSSGKLLGILLTAMQDYNWNGLLAYGVSGCGKSLVAKSAANEFGARALKLDLARLEGGLVGQTAQQAQQAMDMLYAIGGSRVFFIASMNQIVSLPPELRRRFAAGTWYFDVPDQKGRHDIWKISARQFGVDWDGYDAANLTGADIRDICQRSYELSCTTTEAAEYHVPLCQAAPDAIAQSREDAQGRYLDANLGGRYSEDRAGAVSGTQDREIDLS